MNKEEIQEILEELHLVRPEILQPKAKKLFEAIMIIADERDGLQQRINKALHRIQLLQMDGEVTIKDLGLIVRDLKGSN